MNMKNMFCNRTVSLQFMNIVMLCMVSIPLRNVNLEEKHSAAHRITQKDVENDKRLRIAKDTADISSTSSKRSETTEHKITVGHYASRTNANDIRRTYKLRQEEFHRLELRIVQDMGWNVTH